MPVTLSSGSNRLLLWALGGAVVVLASVLLMTQRRTPPDAQSTSVVPALRAAPTGPPWIYGRPGARFTLVEYADLECPYCRDYFPVLRRWIDENLDVNWQWHHLPLSAHEPTATQAARLAECAGQIGGNAAFWKAVAWIYQRGATDTAGLAAHAQLTQAPSALQTCVDAARPDALIQKQAAEAARDGIQATPTVRVIDQHTGRTLTLAGPAEGDVLLSAIDLLLTRPDHP